MMNQRGLFFPIGEFDMNTEDDFVRSVASRPEDRAVRMAYHDWLKGRNDPRATYLRSEFDWANDFEANPSSYKGMAVLSRSAGSIDPAWLSQVSLVSAAVLKAWTAVTDLPGVARRGQPPSDPATNFSSAHDALKQVISSRLGENFSTRNFQIPVDYMSYLCRDGGSWSWDEWGDIHSADELVAMLDDELDACGQRQAESIRSEGLWLHIADWHDRDGYYLCVDPEHPLFNVVIVEGGDRLWENGLDGLGFAAPTFLHFLTATMPAMITNGPSWSCHQTVGNWLGKARSL